MKALYWTYCEFRLLINYLWNWRRFARKDRQWILILVFLYGLLLLPSYGLFIGIGVIEKPLIAKPNGIVKHIHLYLKG